MRAEKANQGIPQTAAENAERRREIARAKAVAESKAKARDAQRIGSGRRWKARGNAKKTVKRRAAVTETKPIIGAIDADEWGRALAPW